ncbi:MAG: metallophosphoesterase [Candidatus Altiarchaeota archaeon]
MKAMCVADIHGDIETLNKLRKSVAKIDVDYFFLLGDYSFDPKNEEKNKADVTNVVGLLSDYNVRAIPGNCDHKSIISILEKSYTSLHKTVMTLIPGYSIIGFGGSNPTPFNTEFEYSEAEILESLNNLYSKVDEGTKVILIAHAPPKDTKCDVIRSGLHVGSSAIRQFIESKKPDLVLCSHIHESGGAEDTLGETRIVNIGRLSEGRAYLLTLSGDIKLEFYKG